MSVHRRHKRSCPRPQTGCKCPWGYYIDRGIRHGVRQQVTKSGFPTKSAATAAEADVRKNLATGNYDPARARLTVADWLDTWLAERGNPDATKPLRPTTVRSYRQHVDDYLKPHLGHHRLGDLRHQHVERMYVALRGRKARPLSEQTLQRVHATLLSAVAHAVRQGVLAQSPIRPIEWRPTSRREPTAWTADEWAAFAAVAKADRLWPLLLVTLDAGLRRGEIAGLRWQDVDLDAGTITVQHTRVVADGRIVAGPPKSGRTRKVALTGATVAALRSWSATTAAERLRVGEAYRDSGYLAVDEAGEPLPTDALFRVFRALTSRAGVRPIRLHDLRATSAAFGLATGEPIYALSKRLGHQSVAVTETAYASILDSVQREDADRRSTLLGP